MNVKLSALAGAAATTAIAAQATAHREITA
jgi:hypothetical protein